MPGKKYLIVSRSFYPANSPRANRTTELAKELCRQGHQVTVLTPHHPEQDEMAKEYGMKLIDLGENTLPDIPTAWRGRSNLPLRALRRGLSIGLSYPEVQLAFRVPRALKRIEHHDVLISIAAPHAVHWGVARAFARRAKPADVWIADCGDPFMGQENDSFSAAFYFKYPEKAFCRRADAIAVPVDGAREAYYPEFRDKIHVIPQGFRFEDYAHLESIEPAHDGMVRLAYAGLFIPGRRDPTRFLQHLVARKEPFEFHVFTKNPALVTPFAERDSRIILRDFMPREDLLVELARMDFLVNFENAGARQTPSKLIDYWLCRRPILNLRSDGVPGTVIDQFFQADYRDALEIDRPERYDIRNVAAAFDRLADTQAAQSRAAQ